MSLTKQIEDPGSQVGTFLRRFFPSSRNRRFLGGINRELARRESLCCLGDEAGSWVHGLIGQALDYRIRYHFANTPGSRLKTAWEGLWAITRVGDLVHALDKDPARYPDYAMTDIGAYPPTSGTWEELIELPDLDKTIWAKTDAGHGMLAPMFSLFPTLFREHRSDIDQVALPLNCALRFAELLSRTTERTAAHRRRPTVDEERTLARLCLVLSVFESLRRSGGRGWPPPFFGRALPRSAEDLLDTIPVPWVEDVTGLTAMFVDRHSAWRGAPAVLNPEFAGARDVGGADGDIIVDGCLWDIKTTTQEKARGIWLYQLLGYVLLDYEDEFAIDHVGFLFPRQDATVQWPLDEFLHDLSGHLHISLPRLRRELSGTLQPTSRNVKSGNNRTGRIRNQRTTVT